MKPASLSLPALAIALALSGCASWKRIRVKPRPADPASVAAVQRVAAEMREATVGVVFTSP